LDPGIENISDNEINFGSPQCLSAIAYCASVNSSRLHRMRFYQLLILKANAVFARNFGQLK
jgi:hypothetical protein